MVLGKQAVQAAPPKPKLVMVLGPTACGKTDLAVSLAQQIEGEVISVDSALVYRHMDIGTAKPTQEERQGIPHHLIDVLEPEESYSASIFREQALTCIDEINVRGKVPIVAGGTMLYVRALLSGLASMPESDPLVRDQLNHELHTLGAQALHARLQTIDPDAAQRIHVNDPQRLLRALEVHQLSGKTLTQHHREQQQFELPFDVLKIALMPPDRELHRKRVSKRFEKMLEGGFVEEVEDLRKRPDLHLDLPSMRSVGYRQVWQYLDGEWDYSTMLQKGITATHQLAKRQTTWLRKEPELVIYDCFDPPKMNILRQIHQFLE